MINLALLQARSATVWHRAGILWKFLAIGGVVIAAGLPLSLAYVGSAHGISHHAQDSAYDLGDFFFYIVSPLVIAGIVFVVWLEMIRSGRLAWLWAAPWAVSAFLMLVCSSLNIATGGVSDIWVVVGQLALYGSQIWVALTAWKLGRAGSNIPR